MKESIWSKAFQGVYTEEGLKKSGILPSDDLVVIHSEEGDALYPQFQFRATGQIEPGVARLEARSRGLEYWTKYYKPAIEDGVMEESTAAANFAGRDLTNPLRPSRVEELDSPLTTPERLREIEFLIDITMKSWRSP